MVRIGIIGAGIAGLTCGEALVRAGHSVRLFDKGRGPGGRMSTRRLQTTAGEAQFDHGAQYFTARDAGFRQQVETWIAEGLAAPWPPAGDGAYVGVPAMNAPVRSMAKALDVLWSAQIERIEGAGDRWRLVQDDGDTDEVDLLVVATPAEQAADLLSTVAPDLSRRARSIQSAPCWTLMLAFSDAVAVSQVCWGGDAVIGWAARNSAKPGRTGPETWVVQANPDWSTRHLEADPAWVAAELKEALSKMLEVRLPPLAGEACHRWRFARAGADGSGALFDRQNRIGLCGDWLLGPRIEAAWLSGRTLARQIADNVMAG